MRFVIDIFFIYVTLNLIKIPAVAGGEEGTSWM